MDRSRSRSIIKQTTSDGWHRKKEWKGLKSIGMEEKTIQKDGKERKEWRYYISSLKDDVELFSRAARGIGVWKVCIGI